jgi:exonuclease SbcC
MITSIRLVNWRSHKDTTFKFSRGTNLLVGIMGAGKSAVLDGISFALFGTFPALERRRLKLENVVRYNEDSAAVILGMEWDGNRYRVERKIKKAKNRVSSSSEIFRDSSLIDSGTTAVTSYVEQLLGVDYDLFTRAIYSEQNNIDYFLNLDPRRRKEEIDRLLGLDRFEEARANIVSVINRTESNRKTLQEKYDPKTAVEVRKNLSRYEKEIGELNRKLERITAEYREAAKDVKEKEMTYWGLRKKKEKYEKLVEELTKIRGMTESIKGEIEPDITEELYNKTKNEMEKLNEGLRGLEKKEHALDKDRTKLSKEMGSIDAQLKEQADRKQRVEKLGKALKTLLEGKTHGDLEGELENLEEGSLKLNSERNALEGEMAELKELLEKIKPGIANCPLCGTELDEKGIEHVKREKNTLIEKNKGRIKDIDSKIPELREKIDHLKMKLKKIDFAIEKKEGYIKELKDTEGLENKKKTLEKETTKIEEEAEYIGREISEKRKEAEKLLVSVERYGKTIERRKRLVLLSEKMKGLEEEKKKTEYHEKDYENARGSLEDAKLKKQKTESDKDATGRQLKMTGEMAEELRKRTEELKENEETVKRLTKLSEELKIYKNALLDTQITLRKSLIEAINAAMNEIWEIFYPYRNYSDVRLEVTEKDYTFQVHERGEWKPLETVASGGERACAALTLRVALATVLTPNLSWLILDEPTHNLDKEAINLLSETLQLKVPQVVKQTFVITHEEGLIGADFAASYRLRREKEADGPTEIEDI